jgi:hypothetical protein
VSAKGRSGWTPNGRPRVESSGASDRVAEGAVQGSAFGDKAACHGNDGSSRFDLLTDLMLAHA